MYLLVRSAKKSLLGKKIMKNSLPYQTDFARGGGFSELTESLDETSVNQQLPFPCLNFAGLPQNIFGMDLRSAHKEDEKAPPRLRLSITRSMSTDVEQVYRRPLRRRNRQRVTKGYRKYSNKSILEQKRKVEKDWGGTSDDDKAGCESTTEERCGDSLYGRLTTL